jgi:hypothetical protein
VAAHAVIVDAPTASALAGTYWGMNEHLMAALIDQSRAIKDGLYLIAGGSLMQMVAVALQVARSLLSRWAG